MFINMHMLLLIRHLNRSNNNLFREWLKGNGLGGAVINQIMCIPMDAHFILKFLMATITLDSDILITFFYNKITLLHVQKKSHFNNVGIDFIH